MYYAEASLKRLKVIHSFLEERKRSLRSENSTCSKNVPSCEIISSVYTSFIFVTGSKSLFLHLKMFNCTRHFPSMQTSKSSGSAVHRVASATRPCGYVMVPCCMQARWHLSIIIQRYDLHFSKWWLVAAFRKFLPIAI